VLIYAGIGPRDTPAMVQDIMSDIAAQLAPKWLLRSGHARGADMAFERGAIAAKGKMEIFLPWEGFNGQFSDGVSYGTRTHDSFQQDTASSIYMAQRSQNKPPWSHLKQDTRALFMRNVPIILGEFMNVPVDCVITWTPNDEYDGGTKHAMGVAGRYNLPIFDIRTSLGQSKLIEFTRERENA